LSGLPDEPAVGAPVFVRHNRVELALHRVSDGADPEHRTLLLLHGLGEATPASLPDHVDWPGPVIGLDFTGHGRSTVPVGGGYTSEILVGDVDAALAAIEPAEVTILGRGLGAYIGLLVAAARPTQVRGVVLADGPGLAGGGVHPGSPSLPHPLPGPRTTPDEFALLELARDVRPADYAQTFARFVVESSDLEVPLFVTAVVRPEWLTAVASEPGVADGSLADGLASYASSP
jgi:pimeloyl-ACP methyl ester carboxylesterase